MGLSPGDRRFLGLVAQAVCANPFSEERARVDQEISGLSDGADADARLTAGLTRIREFLTRIGREGPPAIRAFSREDRELVETAHLFDVFHRFRDPFDDLIQQQIRQDAAPCPVPFAREVLELLAARGFAPEAAGRALAMFYQLRRAYFFIDRALVGRSPCMRQLRLALWNNVFTRDVRLYERHLWNRMEDFSTLLLGETGTGKGAAAAAIGRSGFIPFDEKRQCFSESFARSFIAINLSQFPESLIESELFGHRKGAFTGAVEAHEGVFARCSPHGAIFLDEIGDVSIPVQIKLLNVLQVREFSPVGSHEKRRFNGRVIAASNRPLDELRQRGAFRDDFFYRLCSDTITAPPLRRRLGEEPGELRELVEVTIQRIVGERSAELTDLACGTIEKDPGREYPWPGNVRELEQCVRRILLTHAYHGERAGASPDPMAALARGIEGGTLSSQELLAAYCRLLHGRHGTYEEVARRTGLDRRTVKKYVLTGAGR
jgi:DNA-binding NtrC family response regulator